MRVLGGLRLQLEDRLVTARKIVELFHLVFVRALFANLQDKRLLALKGGINLRFFFQSVRFSEDLDVDVMTMSKAALENRVDRLLASPTVISPLKTRGIIIRDISKPKQTEMVQRWKLEIASPSTMLSRSVPRPNRAMYSTSTSCLLARMR